MASPTLSEGCPSLVSSPAGGRGRRPGTAAAAAAPPSTDAWLAMRDECQQAKLRERAAEEKLKQLAAQLMRTEEAAKRILTRTDPTARGGCAQRLLEAEREVGRLKAALAEAESALAAARRQGSDAKRHAGELKKRLDAALSDQRRLALQLGRAQAGGGSTASGGSRGLAVLCCSPLLPPWKAAAVGGSPGKRATDVAAGQPAAAEDGAAAEAEAAAEAAAAARRFAQQQEELASARERCARLEQQLGQREALLQEQARELCSLRAQAAHFSSSTGGGGEATAAAAVQWGSSSGAAGASPRRPQRASDGEGGDGWLRLKVLKSQSAVDSLQRANSRLLHELEGARERIAQLQHAAQQGQAAAGDLPPWEPPSASLQQQQQLLLAQLEQRSVWCAGGQCPGPQGSTGGDGLGAAPGAMLQLRQQLAAANHRAARLQIELDAASAKLAIYQAHHASMRQEQLGAAQPADAMRQASPSRTASQLPSQQEEQRAVRAERVASWLRSQAGPPASGKSAPMAAAGAGAAAEQQEAAPVEGGLAEHENLVELHLHAAELDASLATALGPLGLTFLSVDLQGFDTKLSALAEGRSPVFNTTCRFVCPMTRLFVHHLASGSARVQLHCCRGGGAAADYDTLASGDIPLASLLAPGAAHEYQQCTLSLPDGRACGTLQYALAALKPVRCHPSASLLPGAATQQQHRQQASSTAAAAAAGGAAAAGRQPRLAVRVVGCRDLRPPHGSHASAMLPYVVLLLPAGNGAAGGQAAFETRPAAGGGGSPSFQEAALLSVGSAAAAAGLALQAVVLDDAVVGPAEDAVIGSARIPVPPAGGVGGCGSSGGRSTVHPLLHPGSGRHAGTLELVAEWQWD